jgi:hypothetical protein
MPAARCFNSVIQTRCTSLLKPPSHLWFPQKAQMKRAAKIQSKPYARNPRRFTKIRSEYGSEEMLHAIWTMLELILHVRINEI